MFMLVPSSLWMNTKIPNFEHSEHWMSKHRTFWTSQFGPKSNFEHVEHHQKTEQFTNIKLYVPRLVWSHNNQTELWHFQTSHFGPKQNFVHVEHHKKPNSSHQTVRSKTNKYQLLDRYFLYENYDEIYSYVFYFIKIPVHWLHVYLSNKIAFFYNSNHHHSARVKDELVKTKDDTMGTILLLNSN